MEALLQICFFWSLDIPGHQLCSAQPGNCVLSPGQSTGGMCAACWPITWKSASSLPAALIFLSLNTHWARGPVLCMLWVAQCCVWRWGHCWGACRLKLLSRKHSYISFTLGQFLHVAEEKSRDSQMQELTWCKTALAFMKMLPGVQHHANGCTAVKGSSPGQLLLGSTLVSTKCCHAKILCDPC